MKFLFTVILAALAVVCLGDDSAPGTTPAPENKPPEIDQKQIMEKCVKNVGFKNFAGTGRKGKCLRNCMLREMNAINEKGHMVKEGMKNYIQTLKDSGVWESSGMNKLFKADFEVFFSKCQNVELDKDP